MNVQPPKLNETLFLLLFFFSLQEDTAGDYQKALLYLCGGND